MKNMMTGGLAVLAALTAQSGWAGDALPRFGWGAPLARTQETLGGLVSAPRSCTRGWKAPVPGCQALVVGQHRLGSYLYRLELQHRPDAGLHRILVTPAAVATQSRDAATAYAILVFDAAFTESHGKLAANPVFRHPMTGPEKSGTGYEWFAQYGPLASRLRLHAQVAEAGEGGAGIMIEQ